MKRFAVVMIVVCLLGMVSVANAKLLDVFHPYLSAGYAYGWGMKGYGVIDLGDGKNKSSGYNLKAGIDLLPYLAIEEEYLELKGFNDTVILIRPSGILTGDWASDFKIMISNLKLRYPFKAKNVKIVPFFTLGKGYADTTFKQNYKIDYGSWYFVGSSKGLSRYPCYKTGGGVDVETKHFRVSLEYSYLVIKKKTETGYTAYMAITAIGYKF